MEPPDFDGLSGFPSHYAPLLITQQFATNMSRYEHRHALFVDNDDSSPYISLLNAEYLNAEVLKFRLSHALELRE